VAKKMHVGYYLDPGFESGSQSYDHELQRQRCKNLHRNNVRYSIDRFKNKAYFSPCKTLWPSATLAL
jgi:hypothetical protein